jgi:type IV pilus assembly protein PilW
MSIEIAMKKNRFPRLLAGQQGMGLVEILVGLVIGLIGVLVIFQTMAVWGERTATTVSGGDSRTSGAVGMHYLEQDLAQGGLGFGRTNATGRQFVPGCDVTVPSGITPEGGNFRLAAVDINDGASGAPDTVTVLYAGSSDANVNFSDVALFKPVSGKYSSDQGRALQKDDWVVLARQGGCELRKVSEDPLNPGKHTLNQIVFTPTPTVTSGNLLYLGGQPQRATWSILNGALLRTESRFTTRISPISDSVVDIQAEYGLLDGTTWTWQPGDPSDWSQVRAIKVALLVRSKQFEKTNVTIAPPVWHRGDGSAENFVMADPGDGTEWERYRYEVFERTIPLRNLIWGAQP